MFIPGQHSWLLSGFGLLILLQKQQREVLLLLSSSIPALLGFSFYTHSGLLSSRQPSLMNSLALILNKPGPLHLWVCAG